MSNEKNLQDEIVDQLIKRTDTLEKKVEELDKREVEVPDHTQEFIAQARLIKGAVQDFKTSTNELKAAVEKHNLQYPATIIQQQLESTRGLVKSLPKFMPVKHEHWFDPKTKPVILGGIIWFIVMAMLTGLCVHLWVENNRLSANDMKFRMIRQTYPVQANWADKYYSANPTGMKNTTEQLENEAMERSEAVDMAHQKEREAKAAKEKLIKLKKHH